ncbi:DUF6766 family protein [Streptomyces sp. NPDC046924]|uniref:DUF6766 family protein n=1 Tax=Streptomyces sp. NPDC046924 TaxID=3155136 RepID=UPI00340064F7
MAGRARGVAVSVLLTVGAAGGVSGCGTVAERRDAVRGTAALFEQALGAGAYDRACAVLAPATVEELEQSAGEYAAKDSPEWAKAGGWRRAVHSNSLLPAMGTIFILSWLVQSITGTAAYNEQRLRQLQAPLSWADYLGAADFWNRTLQNWQSELLAVASMAVLSIYLRQRGSPEFKPVGAAHGTTGVGGLRTHACGARARPPGPAVAHVPPVTT